MKVTNDVDKLLAQFPAEVQVTALKTRELVLKTIPKAIEIADPSAKVIGYGFGSGYKDLICTVMLSKNGVKLGIAHGAALPDPEGVLEGTGKVHRYIALSKVTSRQTIQDYLRAALAAHQARTKKVD
jgi:hypothetical protein